MVMVCAVIYLLEPQHGSLLRARDFLFEQFTICLYYSCSVGFLPDRVFQNYVTHGIPSRPTNPARWVTHSQRSRREDSPTLEIGVFGQNTSTRLCNLSG